VSEHLVQVCRSRSRSPRPCRRSCCQRRVWASRPVTVPPSPCSTRSARRKLVHIGRGQRLEQRPEAVEQLGQVDRRVGLRQRDRPPADQPLTGRADALLERDVPAADQVAELDGASVDSGSTTSPFREKSTSATLRSTSETFCTSPTRTPAIRTSSPLFTRSRRLTWRLYSQWPRRVGWRSCRPAARWQSRVITAKMANLISGAPTPRSALNRSATSAPRSNGPTAGWTRRAHRPVSSGQVGDQPGDRSVRGGVGDTQ